MPGSGAYFLSRISDIRLEWIYGSNGDDSFNHMFSSGVSRSYSLYGGHDSVVGTSNADSFVKPYGTGFISGFTGTDQLSFLGRSTGVNIDVQLGSATGSGLNISFRSIEKFRGTSSDDIFIGSTSGDEFNGLLGDDTAFGGNGADRLSGFSDDDTLFGGANADSVFGGHGDDEVHGDAGSDIVSGGFGDDTIVGGTGGDRLYGGGGRDIFVFKHGDTDRHLGRPDHIRDFEMMDQIVLPSNASSTLNVSSSGSTHFVTYFDPLNPSDADLIIVNGWRPNESFNFVFMDEI